MLRGVAALGAVLLLAGVARADPREDYLGRLAAAVRAGLDDAVRARMPARLTPALVPPVPFKVRWKPVRLGTLDLRAPLVAIHGADLDGDRKAELYVVTSREVIAFGLADRVIKEVGSAPFGGAPAVPAPRDAVGTAVIDGGELVAASSPWARELRVGWRDHVLVARTGEAGYLVCPGERAALVPGRNHFGDVVAPIYGVRCRDDLVDPEGHPLRVRGTLTGTRLEVTVERCGAGGACELVNTYAYSDYGAVFELADVDRDGRPEVIVTGAGAPGAPDAVKVITLGADAKKGRFRQPFLTGVLGVAVLDGDGDGKPEVIAAVRLEDPTRVELWRLD